MERIAFLDFDGTLSPGYVSMAFHQHLAEQGLYSPHELRRQQHYRLRMELGKLSFEDWVRTIERWGPAFRGRSAADVEAAGREFAAVWPLYDSTPEVVRRVREKGYTPLLLSAAQEEVIRPLAASLGMDTLCTALEKDSGIFTGKLLTSFHLPQGKQDAVRAYLSQVGATPEDCLAMGDSPHDVPLLELVGRPIALNPRPELEAIARQRGWPCRTHETILDYLSGF